MPTDQLPKTAKNIFLVCNKHLLNKPSKATLKKWEKRFQFSLNWDSGERINSTYRAIKSWLLNVQFSLNVNINFLQKTIVNNINNNNLLCILRCLSAKCELTEYHKAQHILYCLC